MEHNKLRKIEDARSYYICFRMTENPKEFIKIIPINPIFVANIQTIFQMSVKSSFSMYNKCMACEIFTFFVRHLCSHIFVCILCDMYVAIGKSIRLIVRK